MDDADARSCLSGTSCSSASVSVALDIVGKSVVDDVCEVFNIESAGCHIGGNEQLDVVMAELVHRQVALCLRQFSMQGLGIISVADESVGYFLGFQPRAAENDGVDFGIKVCYPLQGVVFVLCLHKVVDMVDVFCTFVSRSDHDFLRVVEIVLADTLDFLAHRGREEQRVAFFRNLGQDGVDALAESHAQHLVSLVENDVLHFVELSHAPLHEVDKTSWSGHHHLYSFLQLTYLSFDACSSVDGEYMQSVDIFAV